MWISKYFVYMMIFSCMGWIYESLYCTIKGGKWENRGFLYGPVCPIYGVGATAMTAIADVLSGYNISYTWWQVFAVAFFGSIVLEYVTSWTLEKLFHAYWWDYSEIPFNINGRVCLPCSLGFGVAGLVVVYWLAPPVRKVTGGISPIFMELLSLVLMALLTMDITLTVSALSNFERTIIGMEETLNRHMDSFVTNIQDKTQVAGNTFSAERAKFSKENIEQGIKNMGDIYRAALKRVKGFRETSHSVRAEKLQKKFCTRKSKKIRIKENDGCMSVA